MTVLSRSALDPQMVTVQCDICSPVMIVTMPEEAMAAAGWQLRSRGARADVCHVCSTEAPYGTRLRVDRAKDVSPDVGHLPNFVVIGAAKAGTTSLHHYLEQHPDVFMAERKELQFFQDPDHLSWLSLYRAQFPVPAPVRGEASTLYSRSPAIPGVAGRMAALVPDMRIVYLVREPVERALASYREERFHLNERRPAEEAFADLDDPYNPYVSASRYAEQLEDYLAHFPREQVLVLDQRELASDAPGVLDRVQRFLGLEVLPLDTSQQHNTADTKFEYSGVGQRLKMSRPAVALRRRLPPRVRLALTAPARRAFRRPIEKPELPEATLARMREVLAPDAARLRELTGLELAHWSV